MGEKIVVIGAGVVGAAVAAAAARRGADVTVISRDRLGSGTSSASFAWLNALQKYPREYIDMNVQGMRMHAEYAAWHNSAPWYYPGGNVEWTMSGKETEAQSQVLKEMQSFGYDGRWITADELMHLEPEIDPTVLSGAHIVFYPQEGWIDAPVLVARLLADARADGARVVVPVEVTGFTFDGARITHVRLSDGTSLEADVVVNCGGPVANDVAALAGFSIPLLQEQVGVQVYTAPCAVNVRRVIHAPGLSLRADGGGRFCLHNHGIDREINKHDGLDDKVGRDANGRYIFDLAAATPLLERAAAVFPGMKGVTAEASRIGMRPIPIDRKPVIGFMDRTTNFYSAVMHSGVTQCLWVGELVAREVVDDTECDELRTFRVARFGNTQPAAASA
ncbi:NAD(P)/FAD-dependent oxidoreductase [Microvirga alba]|uniref:FAD-binding oxidoreductase n=1 Tax=Microvirga alba TaxID=2791025 RepID=A0A931BWW7_9HYPH|nr:FAD-dependent oxidoreductase [Microvirga alba]MBF9235330.1 FAD-binding oxidoreductase [Microvirga alba]